MMMGDDGGRGWAKVIGRAQVDDPAMSVQGLGDDDRDGDEGAGDGARARGQGDGLLGADGRQIMGGRER